MVRAGARGGETFIRVTEMKVDPVTSVLGKVSEDLDDYKLNYKFVLKFLVKK